MSRKQESRQVAQVAEAITGLLTTALEVTIAEPSPEPARQCIEEFRELDRRASPQGGGGPAQLMATLALVRWMGMAREHLDRPDLAEEALAWIEESVGRRYRARASYVAGVLRSEEGAMAIMDHLDALRDDFLPALVWLLAATVAVHGGGDVGWLKELESASAAGPV